MDDLVTEPPEKPMTVDEFLRWDDGTDTRYELIDGQIVAMAPPNGRHGTVVVNAGALVNSRLRSRSPCRAQAEAGVRVSEHRWWQADLAVTCQPPEAEIVDPLLVIEVLSPSTRNRDLVDKLPDYKALPSVLEIWLIDSERRWAQVWWREPEGWHGRDHVGGGALRSQVLDGEVMLDELYLNAGL
jgi:Uma2 family endonuclease